ARRRIRRVERRVAQRRALDPLDVYRVAADPVFPGSDRVRPVPAHAQLARGIPARPLPGASRAVRRVAALLAVGVVTPLAVPAQQTSSLLAAQQAESLRLAGRPWHAAETLLAAAARELHLEPAFVLAGAKAELHARRYDRARGLRVGLPPPPEDPGGRGLAVLAEPGARRRHPGPRPAVRVLSGPL